LSTAAIHSNFSDYFLSLFAEKLIFFDDVNVLIKGTSNNRCMRMIIL